MWYFIIKDLLQLQLFGSVAMDSCLEYTTTPAAVLNLQELLYWQTVSRF